MARLLLLAIVALPLIEIAVMIKVGQAIGLLPTLGLLVGAAILGVVLLRQQGFSVLIEMRRRVEEGRVPARAVADAMMIGFAAVLLVLPGFLTDIAGIALLLPPLRTLIYGALARRFVVVKAGGYPPAGPSDPRLSRPGTIDLDDEDYRPH